MTLRNGVATMNPISGTYRYPPSGPSLHGVMDFLADRKESDELYMVLDEELKMMARICEPGVRVTGPRLKEMARLAHTEYFIEGETGWDVRDILRETMFAPTVTGSPVENACRVIDRHEPYGRGYYSGVVALIGRDEDGRQTLDSSILIRTADIDRAGRARMGVGATLVRHSDPMSEVAETRAKAAGLLAALDTGDSGRLRARPEVREALERRNANIAGFWLGGHPGDMPAEPVLTGVRTLIVDAEDTFTSMLDHQLRSLGMSVTVRRHDEALAGRLRPGRAGARTRRPPRPGPPEDRFPAGGGGCPPVRAPPLPGRLPQSPGAVRPSRVRPAAPRHPQPGVQKEIGLFGARERVGFYNTFAARAEADLAEIDGVGTVEICRDPATGEVHALRGPCFSSIQFHAESVLTENGPRILGSLMKGLLS